ncbi:translation initiation factor IF-2 N-terminal domain-containing protein [Desulfobacca acetoxidans]|uniref:translation initiation factor IF-2 N-terminal domain-containing protein n=1 Tax=Desulfobacca acetoxidans TaxID=60893 RepID=UPI00059E582F|nr:translation initiation factor IF-2 N-terminal domain-containing protein [Desulfobacca acetoxidans]
MSKTRVFDLAKELGVDAGELARFLKEKMGLESIHHLSGLDDRTVKQFRQIWPEVILNQSQASLFDPLPITESKISSDNSLIAKLQQVFKYLLELKNLAIPPKRDLKEYGDKTWWQANLPLSPFGCFLREDGRLENKDAWLEVHKQQIPPYPEPPSILAEWIAMDGRDPSKHPSYHSSVSGLSNEEQEELDAIPERIDDLEKDKQYLESQTTPDSVAISQVKGVLDEKYRRWEELEAKKEIKFEDSLDRVAAWETWRLKKWEPWAAEALPKTRIQKFYGELFAAYQRFQKEGEDIELVWGHGLLLWVVKNFYVRRPVLTTRMELNFEAERGIFSVTPTEGVTRLETDMLTLIDLPNVSLLAERNVSMILRHPGSIISVSLLGFPPCS